MVAFTSDMQENSCRELSRRRLLATTAALSTAGCLHDGGETLQPGDFDGVLEGGGSAEYQTNGRNDGRVEGSVPRSESLFWHHRVEPRVLGGIVASDGELFISKEGMVLSFDESGEPVWRADMGEPGEHSFGAPAVRGDRVYVGTSGQSGKLYSLRRSDGEVEWTSGQDGRRTSSATLAEDPLLVATDTELNCVDPETGDVLWRYQDGSSETAPAVDGDLVFHSAGQEQKVVALGIESGGEVWTRSTWDDAVSSPTVGHDYVYATSKDGVVYALDPGSGDVEWSSRFPRERIGYRGGSNQSPAVGDDGVYVVMDSLLAKLDFTGEVLWREAAITNPSSPVVTDEEVVLTTSSGLRCVDAGTGDRLWSFQPPRREAGDVYYSGFESPAYAEDGVVYAASMAGDVYAFQDS